MIQKLRPPRQTCIVSKESISLHAEHLKQVNGNLKQSMATRKYRQALIYALVVFPRKQA
jgi:hypothetical protein